MMDSKAVMEMRVDAKLLSILQELRKAHFELECYFKQNNLQTDEFPGQAIYSATDAVETAVYHVCDAAGRDMCDKMFSIMESDKSKEE